MPERKTTSESPELSTPQDKSWNLVVKWVAVFAAHFRAEMSEPEIRIYCESLQNKDPDRLEKAFRRCLEECEFMPKLKDILVRLPEKTHYFESSDEFLPVSEEVVDNGDGTCTRIFTDTRGYRRVRIERKKPA